MALIAPALADRARVLRQVPSGARVEGRTPVAEAAGEWSPARLVVDGPAREVADSPPGRTRTVQAGRLLWADADVRLSDRIEVESRAVGMEVWEVAGEPQVVVTKRLGRAVVVPVERVVEGEVP